MSIKDFNVTFRYVGIPTELGTLCGICLSYQMKEGAESFFNFIHEHLSASGILSKSFFDVKATRTLDNLYQLVVQVGFGETLRRVEIKGIDPKYITELKASLKIFKYYLFLAGYQTAGGRFVLMPMANNHLLVHNINIDSIQYYGDPNCNLEWEQLLRSEYIVSVE